jgi:hypothetical protein
MITALSFHMLFILILRHAIISLFSFRLRHTFRYMMPLATLLRRAADIDDIIFSLAYFG